MDQLLRACGVETGTDRFMDSNALEKERGITISSKYTSMRWRGHVLNAVDTPGHADFGGYPSTSVMIHGGFSALTPCAYIGTCTFALGRALDVDPMPRMPLQVAKSNGELCLVFGVALAGSGGSLADSACNA